MLRPTKMASPEREVAGHFRETATLRPGGPHHFPVTKSILSVVPAPRDLGVEETLRRALPIEFVELSRTGSYGD